MNDERLMFEARTIKSTDDGMWVHGFICKSKITDTYSIRTPGKNGEWHDVDPDTIRPVKARPIVPTNLPIDCCPNCKRMIDYSGEKPNFCSKCGQALEWEK